jgi:hypothetical protein
MWNLLKQHDTGDDWLHNVFWKKNETQTRNVQNGKSPDEYHHHHYHLDSAEYNRCKVSSWRRMTNISTRIHFYCHDDDMENGGGKTRHHLACSDASIRAVQDIDQYHAILCRNKKKQRTMFCCVDQRVSESIVLLVDSLANSATAAYVERRVTLPRMWKKDWQQRHLNLSKVHRAFPKKTKRIGLSPTSIINIIIIIIIMILRGTIVAVLLFRDTSMRIVQLLAMMIIADYGDDARMLHIGHADTHVFLTLRVV